MKLQFCNLERNKICLRQNTKNETLPIFDSVKDLIQSKVFISQKNFHLATISFMPLRQSSGY